MDIFTLIIIILCTMLGFRTGYRLAKINHKPMEMPDGCLYYKGCFWLKESDIFEEYVPKVDEKTREKLEKYFKDAIEVMKGYEDEMDN